MEKVVAPHGEGHFLKAHAKRFNLAYVSVTKADPFLREFAHIVVDGQNREYGTPASHDMLRSGRTWKTWTPKQSSQTSGLCCTMRRKACRATGSQKCRESFAESGFVVFELPDQMRYRMIQTTSDTRLLCWSGCRNEAGKVRCCCGSRRHES